MNAEAAYLFRHALLRDAAYQLQLPGDRARLHALAFAAIEEVAGGRAPEPAPVDAANPLPFLPHPTDPFARELAEHARLAASGFECAVGIHREVQDRRFEGYHLCSLSRQLVAERRFEEARRAWCAGAVILRELGHTQDLADQAAGMRDACVVAGVPPMDEAPA